MPTSIRTGCPSARTGGAANSSNVGVQTTATAARHVEVGRTSGFEPSNGDEFDRAVDQLSSRTKIEIADTVANISTSGRV